MKYASFLPLTALFALSLISVLVTFEIIPPGDQILGYLEASKGEYFYLVIFAIILLESIVYVGFYFPGQFFAVILVVGANPRPLDILYLTIVMVIAATIGSLINYQLGRFSHLELSHTNQVEANAEKTKTKHLLLAMIHMNSLAFFMFAQGAQRKAMRVVGLAGLLNLPYYLLLIAGTAVLSEQVMQMAENTLLLFSLIGIWLFIAMIIDIRRYRQRETSASI
jgi:membrane-associated protein